MDCEYSLHSVLTDAITDTIFYALCEEGMMFLSISIHFVAVSFCVSVKLSCAHVYVSYGHVNIRFLLQPEHYSI